MTEFVTFRQHQTLMSDIEGRELNIKAAFKTYDEAIDRMRSRLQAVETATAADPTPNPDVGMINRMSAIESQLTFFRRAAVASVGAVATGYVVYMMMLKKPSMERKRSRDSKR